MLAKIWPFQGRLIGSRKAKSNIKFQDDGLVEEFWEGVIGGKLMDYLVEFRSEEFTCRIATEHGFPVSTMEATGFI